MLSHNQEASNKVDGKTAAAAYNIHRSLLTTLFAGLRHPQNVDAGFAAHKLLKITN